MVEREPLHPAQEQLAVTTAICGIEIDPERCVICGGVRGIALHHAVYKSKGGGAGPVVPLCLTCHENEHQHRWHLEVEPDGLFLYDAEGQPIWRLKRWPLPGEAGDLVALLDRVTEATKLMPEIAPALLPWQAAEVFRALREVGEGGWRAQSRLASELYHWRMPGISGPDRIEALRSLFGLRRSQCYNLVNVGESFTDSPALEETQLGMRYAIEASRTEEPEAWLRFAQERKLENDAFSSDDLKAEIIRAGARKQESPTAEPKEPPKVWARCPHCGVADWMVKLPVGSTGEPVNVEEYRE